MSVDSRARAVFGRRVPALLGRGLVAERAVVGRDALIVLVYALLLTATGSPDATVPGGASGTTVGDQEVPLWLQSSLMAAATLPVALRRLAPLPVFCWVSGVSAVAVVCEALWDPFLPAAFALYTVTVTREGRRWWERRLPGLAILLLSVAALFAPSDLADTYWWSTGPGQLLLGFAALLAAGELGRVVRERRALVLRTGQQMAQRAVTEERLRIARELHDVVTHSMGLIVVKASVANHVVRTRPEEAHDALRIIEATGRGALTEMRHMLGVLRSDTTGERLPAALGPAPGPGALPELARRAGAELTAEGLDGLPEGVGLAVHRIVQEALTNVLRHAGPAAPCRVRVTAADGVIHVEVVDDGWPFETGVPVERHRRETRRPEGHGLVGMRERVALYGGTFTAGPRDTGGFAVRATLPYAEPPADARVEAAR
ncbi:histidine kinase [Streptomyces sp. S4.7]|uniref:sensor histidine kinase n=1 Tax=Streptomyces sp. S4.7 TaxID=2705439 RepID=UPI0013DC633A|nr:histidine kinase [Streptomyces sp. S4.7]